MVNVVIDEQNLHLPEKAKDPPLFPDKFPDYSPLFIPPKPSRVPYNDSHLEIPNTSISVFFHH